MTISLAPHELDGLLDSYPDIECLSLDCFDTLLWRDTHAPRDIFHALPGASIIQRASAESHARRAAEAGGRPAEISIEEIYAELLPNAAGDTLKSAVEAEIAAEARHCYAFAPVVALMKAARARGLKVVIVSDTYLSSPQLRSLISQSAGEDIATLVDQFFCSSKFGKPKACGLYEDVLRKLKLAPQKILHIGDNYAADVEGVARFGVQTVHLAQFSETARQRLRLEASIDSMIHAGAAAKVRAPLPHRAAMSIAEPLAADDAERLGMTFLGPVMCGFERWLKAEAAELADSRGGKVHWLFLMRDGHLAQQVHALFGPHDNAHAVEISRFTATAASLTSDKAVQAFTEREFGSDAEAVALQMLIPENEVSRLIGGLSKSDACRAVLREARSGARRKATVRAARGFADRLVRHIEGIVQPARGDTLMLIDLGYNGTVQNCVDALLRERLGVHIAGRYLLLRETNLHGIDKRGFFSAEHYDAFTLEAMCSNVAVLEQLCTRASGSVVDYEDDGTPIRKANDIKQQQSRSREAVQMGCLKFQAFEDNSVLRVSGGATMEAWREGAASAMMRMMFLPGSDELAVIEQFQHDVNLGTGQTVGLFDRRIAHRGLRERGLFYMNSSERMYLPAELHGQGMATRLSLLTQRRFGLPLTFADMADATIQLPVIFANQREAVPQLVTATSTHDGHFLAAIPVGAGEYSVALQFGALFDYFEIDSLSFHKVSEFLSTTSDDQRRVIPADPSFEQIEAVAGRLMRCEEDCGFVMVHPPEDAGNEPLMLACVFRPTVVRAPNAAGPATEPVQELVA